MIAHNTYFVLIAMNCRITKIPAKKNWEILPYYHFKNKTCTKITLEIHGNYRCIADQLKQSAKSLKFTFRFSAGVHNPAIRLPETDRQFYGMQNRAHTKINLFHV